MGRFASLTLDVLRWPYTWTKKLFESAFARPEASTMPERLVLESGLSGWIDHLRKDAVRKASGHPLWLHVQQGFNTGLDSTIKDRFNESFRGFQISLGDEVERTARAIHEDLEKNPVALNAFRGTKFTLEVASITGAAAAILYSGGLALPFVAATLVVAPLSASVIQMLSEFFGKQYVDVHREQTRARQEALVQQQISGPLSEWLTQWPTTGGSAYERLQLVLRRLPQNLQQLEATVEAAIK
jgi:hypothetical protein